MDLAYYANLAEIIGTAAIVVSLVYVAVQIRQNNRHLAQEAQRARAQSFRENMGRMGDNAESFIKDRNGETLTEIESFRLERVWMQNLWGYQTSFQQLRRDEIGPGANFFRDGLKTMSSLRATWEKNRNSFHPEFVRYMEENVFNER